ncbi:hypothetical protein ACHAXN_006326 [Cyclotella atomus]
MDTLTKDESCLMDEISALLGITSIDDRREEITQIKHIHQQDTWDCGLTCIQMALQHLNNVGKYNLSIDQAWMREFVGTESIWTIDLVTLLHYTLQDITQNATTLSYVFCSTKFGVRQSYSDIEYYHAAFEQDLQRVERLFASVVKEKIPLLQVSHLSLKVLVNFVSKRGCIAVVLIDNRVLLNQTLEGEEQCSTDTVESNAYSGHYLILCGVSYDNNDLNYAKTHYKKESTDDIETPQSSEFCFVVKNPGNWKERDLVPSWILDKAWRSSGTDEDIIFLNFFQ